jgi:hypothetical protein
MRSKRGWKLSMKGESMLKTRYVLCGLVAALLLIGPAGSAFATGDPPVANPDEATAERQNGEPATVTINVLANDNDPENDSLSIQDYMHTSTEGGTVSCTQPGDCTYTDPGGPAPFDDSFTYAVTDGTSTATGQVTVHVQGGGVVGPPLAQVPRSFSSFKLVKHLTVKGELEAAGNTRECVDSVLLKIQRRTATGWKTVRNEMTDTAGRFSGPLRDKAGKYRAIAPAHSREANDGSAVYDCHYAKSDTRTHSD